MNRPFVVSCAVENPAFASNGLNQSFPRQRRGGILLRLAIVVLVSAVFAGTAAASSLPRKSPEFAISEPSGKTTLLSSLHGKVVVLEFFFLQSDHCTRVAKMLNNLNAKMGARGFQALGVVFDPRNTNSHGELVGPAVVFFKLTYPVGYSKKADVDRYLDRKGQEILKIPQIVVIDRDGMIRATTGGADPDRRLEDESSLQELVEGLLNEPIRASQK